MGEKETIYKILKAARTAKAQQCKDSFYEFVKYMWPVVCAEKFVYNFHIRYLCNVLQDVGERVIRREKAKFDLIINISPGETKSIIVSQMYNAWLWLHDESIRFLGSSHTHSLSETNSMMCQEIVQSEQFRKTFGVIRLKENMKGKGDFMTVKNGRRKTTSVTTKITGSHFHIIAFDDIVDADTELSYTQIKLAKNHMVKCWSRKVDEDITVFILVMQRVSSNDPTPFFKTLSSRPVFHIRLPAESTPEKPYIVYPTELKKYYVDGLMNPNRKTRITLDKLQSKGITKYNAEYGQTPDDLKGKIVKRDYFIFKKRSDFPPNYFTSKNKLVADTAYTENKKNDPSGFLLCSYKDSFLYLLDFYEEWLEFPEAVDRMAYLMRLFNCDAAYVENKASGLSVSQSIRKLKRLNAIDYHHTGADKRARVVDALPMMEAHRVIIVYDDTDMEQVARMDHFVSTLTQFPDSAVHDESADTIVMAINLCNDDYERSWE